MATFRRFTRSLLPDGFDRCVRAQAWRLPITSLVFWVARHTNEIWLLCVFYFRRIMKVLSQKQSNLYLIAGWICTGGFILLLCAPSLACPGGGNWCAYHPIRSGDSEGLCSVIAEQFSNGTLNFNPSIECHEGFHVMTYGKWCSRNQGVVCNVGRGLD